MSTYLVLMWSAIGLWLVLIVAVVGMIISMIRDDAHWFYILLECLMLVIVLMPLLLVI